LSTEQTMPAHPTPVSSSDTGVQAFDPVTRAFTFLTERPVSLYAASVLRIGYGALYLVFLLREFGYRNEMWGPGSPWTPTLARELLDQTGRFSILTLSDNTAYFQACYALALATAALFMLGWRTRVTSVLFAVVVTSFHGRYIFMTDGGDNLIALMALYLPFTDCGRRWSLDAHRRALETYPHTANRPVPDRPDRLPAQHQAVLVQRMFSTLLHNCGMFVIAAQVCILYGAAGLYKVQGSQWRDGTALHYVLNLDLFQPWPALSHLADSHQVLATVAGYVTVLVQIAFPFALFSRLKYIVLAMLLGMHVAIAVTLGLPVFSGAMIVADAVFLSDRVLLRVAHAGRRPVSGRPAATKAKDLPRPRRLNQGPLSRSAHDRDLVLAFDGDCAFCQMAIDRITKYARPRITSTPWQSLPAPTRTRHRARLDREVLLLEGDQVLLGGADALAYVLRSSPARSFRVAATVAGFPVMRTIARGVYSWVAANRHRIPAGTSSCALDPSSPRQARERSGAEL
jgi:predicted DCC family thiol-disulfide oxidoreductase YuxK